MNWDIIEGKWEQMKGEAQQQWGKLTGDDMDRARGNRDELVGRLQERYGWAREKAENEVDDWAKRAG